MIYFCNATKSFYDSDICGSLPEGLIEISIDQHKIILDKINSGFDVEVSKEGAFAFFEKQNTKEQKEISVRKMRDILISSCDWTILPDSPFTEEQREIWKAYRQQLRDLTKHKDFPDVSFPEKPF